MPEPLLRALDLSLRRRIEGRLAGEFRSASLGVGGELAQVRPYQPGDDVRRFDWNVTARTSEPHVRVDLADRALVTWLLLDRSASMAFGTADRRKTDVAEGVALAIGQAATRRGNRAAVVAFGGGGDRTLPPRQGRAGMRGLLDTLRVDPPADGAGTSLAEALRTTIRLARQRALVVVVSDFRGARDWLPVLRELGARHDVLAIEVRDPRELALPDVGLLDLVDPESGHRLRVDTGRRDLRERFAAAAAAERREVADTLRAANLDHVVLSTAGDWLRDLAHALRLTKIRAHR